jgi:hypothetical protein
MARRPGHGVNWAVAETNQGATGNAWATGRDKTRVDEDFVSTHRAVPTLVAGDAVCERLVRDGVVQVVVDAAVPGHVETRRS